MSRMPLNCEQIVDTWGHVERDWYLTGLIDTLLNAIEQTLKDGATIIPISQDQQDTFTDAYYEALINPLFYYPKNLHHYVVDVSSKSEAVYNALTVGYQPTYQLTVGVNPSDGGSVSSGGGNYIEGTGITLVATPAPGYEFAGWTGDVTSPAASVTFLTLATAMKVMANFTVVVPTPPVPVPPTPVLYKLTLDITPTDGGAISVNPDRESYQYGQLVFLDATPASGYRFSNWSGDINDSSLSTKIQMTRDYIITANFIATPGPPPPMWKLIDWLPPAPWQGPPLPRGLSIKWPWRE